MVVYREIYRNYMVNIMIYGEYPLVMTTIAMERSTIFNGEIHDFDWAIFNSELINYQRVYKNHDDGP